MKEWLIRRTVRDSERVEDAAVRSRYGMLSSVVGILCNLLLFAAKFLIGVLSGSVSIMADSVNNLSDAGSSVVTLIGFKVSSKPADEGHPFGHARAEYIGGLAVAFMILLIGVEFFRNSLDRILHPQALEIRALTLLVLLLSIAVKLWMGSFNRYIGRRISSAALLATAQDSFNDVLSTGAVLLSLIVVRFTGWQLDGWMGLVVALFILWSGIGIARSTVSPLLGQSPPPELVEEIEHKVRAYPDVLGIHDLVVHSYGPRNWFASLHAEVSAAEDILDSHDRIDNIEREVGEELGLHLVIHMDPIVVDDPLVNELREYTAGCVRRLDPALSMHDFRLVRGQTHSNLIFDVTVPPGYPMSDQELAAVLEKNIADFDPNYYAVITFDRSYVSSTSKRVDLG
ncbi:MAG: cation transporter [Provencibacterium sp.]|jgi:cation diffusion facilitator family transporter|nr:cation transporter [Provencibacterium sp.]